MIVDHRGRLFYTDQDRQALRRLDAPEAQPVDVATGIAAPGGLAIDDRGRIIVGQGNGIAPAAIGNVAPAARLLRVSPEGGPVEVLAEGLQMANGLARAADGTIFASSDVGFGIDRVSPDGRVQIRWAQVFSPNGLAIDRTGRWLYAAQTFQPAQISRVDLQDPSRVEVYAVPSPDAIAAGPDGMTIDGRDRLLVTANAAGELWRVDTDRSVCAVGTGLRNASAVAFGHSDRGFSRGRVFVVGFDGTISEVPGAWVPDADAPPPPAGPATTTTATRPRVVLTPARVRVRGGRATFTPRVTLDGRPLTRRLRLAGGRTARTGRPLTVVVGARTRSIPVRFTVRGVVRRRAIALVR